MSNPRPLVIDMYGMLYRISRRNWRKWLQHVADGGDKGITEFGGKLIGVVHYNASDLDENLAETLLEQGE